MSSGERTEFGLQEVRVGTNEALEEDDDDGVELETPPLALALA